MKGTIGAGTWLGRRPPEHLRRRMRLPPLDGWASVWCATCGAPVGEPCSRRRPSRCHADRVSALRFAIAAERILGSDPMREAER